MLEVYKGIGKLIEEMGEVNQILGKLIAFPHGDHPDGKGDLRDRLADELDDLEAAIAYFRHNSCIPRNMNRQKTKVKFFDQVDLSGILISDPGVDKPSFLREELEQE